MAGLVTGSMMSMVEDGILDPKLAPSLRIHLDWIQYKTNFRDPVMVRRTADASGKLLPLAEIAVDLRQADAARLPEDLAEAVQSLAGGADANPERHVYLDEFQPYRDCLIWEFNRLFWRHLADWEAASGKGFEAALPAGSSDANHPDAVADSARKILEPRPRDAKPRGSCPQEIVGLEIGVGTGARAASWLDKFKAIDAEAGTGYYDRLHFILGDYSPTSLERALAAVKHHDGHVSGVPLDALNPFKALGAYRFKIMYVHSTNTYDNLPFDDLVRRDGKLYLVEVRAVPERRRGRRAWWPTSASRATSCPAWRASCSTADPSRCSATSAASRSGARLWDAFKLEERLRRSTNATTPTCRPG